jgi:hypothetical protein
VTKIVKTFEYTGKLAIADLPFGVTTMDVYLWGGAGGKGGGDFAGEGADGAAGHYVQATSIDMRAYAGVKKIAVAVGGAGGDGTEGSGAFGGANGKSLTGYSGGEGGKSGTTGTSGSGGGGGGATTVTMFASGETADTIKIAIAGGGGGSGGSGRQSRGGVGANTNSATSNSPGFLGEAGANHNGDGGGGGAGGGGAAGGKGGSGATGDAGGHPGFSGSNVIPSVGSGAGLAGAALESNGSGTIPGQTNLSLTGTEFGDFNGVQLYTNSRAYGASKGKSAKDGKAVLVFNMPADLYNKDSGSWKKVKGMYQNRKSVAPTGGSLGNGWYKIIGGYHKVGGVWKTIFNSDVNFKLYSEGFGNPSGGPTSGSVGTGGIPTVQNIPASAPNSDRGNDNDGGAFVKDDRCYADANDGFGQLSIYSNHPNQNYGFYSRQHTNSAESTSSGSCFIAGTKVRMADGTDRNIEDVVVGDVVKGHNGDNTVIKLDWVTLGDRKLYTFNDSEHYFFTSEHPFMTEEGWKSVKPEKTKERDGDELYKELKGELTVGDKLVTSDGSIEITDIKSKEINNPEMPLYNFHISNDKSYIADNYVVHNKGCFIAGTQITMADGSTKAVEQIDLKDEVAVGGYVFATGKFLVNNLYDYKGIQVSGSHMVKEDGWVRVEDSKFGKSLGTGDHVVYVFGCENRRILINDTLFTDYFDGFEQEGLKKLGEQYFEQYREHEYEVDKTVVDTANKK